MSIKIKISSNTKTIKLPTRNTYVDKDIYITMEDFDETRLEDEYLSGYTITNYSNNYVTSVRPYAFKGFTLLTDVTLNRCETINKEAFDDCTSLVNVQLPKCKYINTNAFNTCTSLTSIQLPKCKEIDFYAFQNCTSLVTVNLPCCENLHPLAFNNCNSLTDVYLGYKGVVQGFSNPNKYFNNPDSVQGYVNVHVRSEYYEQYIADTKWKASIDAGFVVIVGDYTD